ATSRDSLTDCISTFVVLICTILSLVVKSVPIDGIAGIIVSLFIFYTGIKSVLEIINILIGGAPDQDLIKDIAEFVKGFDKNVVGIHDLMLHDYGPGRQILVLHVEVPAEGNIMELHDLIDNIEESLADKFNVLATIHMDPVYTNNERVTTLKEKTKEIVNGIDENFTIHDFRMNEGDTHANLIFDLVKTFDTKLTDNEIIDIVESELKKYDEKLHAVIKIESPLV
ncbi:MAG: cation-efflux pump, partial [Firmicutes bacterium]|nr:cation-efflux pump [Candidatus Caballimonas caccae]